MGNRDELSLHRRKAADECCHRSWRASKNVRSLRTSGFKRGLVSVKPLLLLGAAVLPRFCLLEGQP